MLKERILTALWGTFLFLSLLLLPWGKGAFFFLLLVVISLLGLQELFLALKERGFQPFQFIGFLSSFAILAPTYFKKWDSLPHILLCILILCFLWGLLFRRGQNLLRDIGVTLFTVIYVVGLFSYLLLISLSKANIHPPSALFSTGSWLCAIIVITNWLSDTCSYFAGRYWGKRRIFPHLSPQKTFEGLIGGIICTVIGGTLLGAWGKMGILESGLLGFTIAISSPLGDLAESAMKRELGIKDFSTLLPGHGGILDRFDSLLFSSFFSFYVLRFLNVIQ